MDKASGTIDLSAKGVLMPNAGAPAITASNCPRPIGTG
jgi:hypothetical protein